MDIKILRKLARSYSYQTQYNYAKELGNYNFFKNNGDLSAVQILFLNLLSTYNSLYMDLALKKDHISEEIINDDLRCEAYLLLKKQMDKKGDKVERESSHSNGSVIFIKKK